ncbi:Transcriptional regulatory protein YciT [Gilliamella apicola]|nr:DNA-binding transcriptional regulator YciT [Gilliamella apicola]AHN25203.1 Transcriptional regulatory protein YciT [Gilliamella apicola]PXV85645.1 DeoR family transcriptional regulator [Gilliamella apicola]
MLYLMNERQQQIIYKVNELNQVSVNDLAEQFNVSVVTIRHDLNFLEQNGYLKREHGYAVAVDSDNLDARMKIKFPLKQKIAEYAASLVNNDEHIFIEGGSTNALLARHLAYTRRITLITSSYYIAQLLKNTDLNVIVIGGEYQKKSESVVGELACLAIKHLHFDKAFIGIDGFLKTTGFSGRNQMRTELVNTILTKPCENIIITDSSKFGQKQPFKLKPIESIHRVITDQAINLNDEQYLTAKRIIVDKVI